MNASTIFKGSFGAAGLTAALLLASMGTTGGAARTAEAQQSAGSGTTLPETIQLTGVVRDFKARNVAGGHPDFQRQPTSGFGHYAYQVADELDSDGKPQFSSTGYKVTTQWRDAEGRNRMPPRPHVASRPGDVSGARSTSTGGALTTADNFRQWFRNVDGVNLSRPLSLTLRRQPGSNVYIFDDRDDPAFSSLGGFFPVNGELWGNSGLTNPDKNFHFTYELDTTFVYRRGTGQVFTFRGDDDVWVFVDGKCVIDLGGVHAAISQTIDLDRCEWLQDGQRYSLKFFFCERHTTQSNFRIETTLELQNARLPATTALAD
jgi:fibro-slime domain-containing protein